MGRALTYTYRLVPYLVFITAALYLAWKGAVLRGVLILLIVSLWIPQFDRLFQRIVGKAPSHGVKYALSFLILALWFLYRYGVIP